MTNTLSIETLENTADLYIRVSTTEQAEEGYSIDEQEARGRAWCDAYGITVNAVHVDAGYSGATLDRPGIKNLIRNVRKGLCKKVIVWKLDRLSRSQKDMLILLEDIFLVNNCSFVSIMESFDTSSAFGRCIVGILAAFAQMERENIKARMMMGKQAGLKEGNCYATYAPIGYRFEMKPEGTRVLVVDPVKAQVVKDMYQMYASGHTLGEISDHIRNVYGVYADRNRREAANQCRRILSNPIYAGRVRLGEKECAGKHEALVSPEVWKQVNNRIAANRATVKRTYVKSNGLLSGLLFCGDCGARMCIRNWGWIQKGVARKRIYACYSVCRSSAHMIRSDHCTNRKHPYTISDLDSIILDEIKKLALDPSALDVLIEANREDSGPDLKAVQERLAEAEKQISRLLTLYQSGVVELEEIQGRLADLKETRAAAQACLDAAEEESSGKMSKAEAVASLASLSDVIESSDSGALFALVHSLIEKVVVLNEDITIHWAFC